MWFLITFADDLHRRDVLQRAGYAWQLFKARQHLYNFIGPLFAKPCIP